jgi:FlaA1/EpsC-like NDP-sugar epimerase
VLPFVAALVPFAYYLQGLYRLRRGRSRVDDFFAVLVGSILAVVFAVISTLYFQTYYASDEMKRAGAYEVSQLVWALFLLLNVGLTFASRELVREALERRWRAGIGLKRVLIAGAGELGRLVADKILEHRELGYKVVGYIDDRGGDHLAYRGLPMLGTLAEAGEIVQREKIDQLYVALPLEEHVKMLQVIDAASRECLDIKVVPDLLQFIALRAGLEEIDGIPIININDVPLQGFNSALKRAIDIMLSGGALLLLALPMVVIALLVRLTSPGRIFYRQERMGYDAKAFTVFKIPAARRSAGSSAGSTWTSCHSSGMS